MEIIFVQFGSLSCSSSFSSPIHSMQFIGQFVCRALKSATRFVVPSLATYERLFEVWTPKARLPLDYGIHKFRWSLQCLHKVSNYKVSSIAPYNRSLFNGFQTKQLSLCVSSQKQTTSNAAGHGFGTIFPSLISGKFKGHTAPSPLDCHFLTRVLGPVRWSLLCSLF